MMSILSLFLLLFVLYVIVKYGIKIVLFLIVWAIRLFIFGLMISFVYELYERSCC
jgi:hypothetical protein